MKKLLRLAVGSRSSLCPVHPGFKLVMITEQEVAYHSLDLPLLNRFEKQVYFLFDWIPFSFFFKVRKLFIDFLDFPTKGCSRATTPCDVSRHRRVD